MEKRPFGKTGEEFAILSFGAQRIVDSQGKEWLRRAFCSSKGDLTKNRRVVPCGGYIYPRSPGGATSRLKQSRWAQGTGILVMAYFGFCEVLQTDGGKEFRGEFSHGIL